MTSKKIFKGVAHNIADHAASYLSWIHPHIEEACLEANLDHITLDLMGLTLFHENIIISNALKSTVNQLRETFKEFVHKNNLDFALIKLATLYCEGITDERSPWFTKYTTTVELVDGTRYIKTVDHGYLLKGRLQEDQNKVPGTNINWPQKSSHKKTPL